MGLWDDFRKIERVELAVGQKLPAGAVYHKDPVIYWRQEFHRLVNERRVFSQK